MIAVVGGAEAVSSREGLGVLRLAQQAARTKEMRNWPGNHVEDGGATAGDDRGGLGVVGYAGSKTRPINCRLAKVAATMAIGMAPFGRMERRGVVRRVDVEAAKGRRS